MILCSDYDRTLRIDDRISKEDREELKRFQQAGHKFCINTGRNYYNLKEELERQQFHCDYYIAGSGSQIYDQDGIMLAGFGFEKETAKMVAKEIFKADSLSIVVGERHRGYHLWREECGDWNEQILAANYDQIYSISTRFKTNELAVRFQHHLEAVCNVNAYVNRKAVDIVMKYVSKATGVDALRNYLVVKKEDVFVIGDGTNDISMIDAYQGFCVNHSEAVVKQFASASFSDVGACIRYLMKKE